MDSKPHNAKHHYYAHSVTAPKVDVCIDGAYLSGTSRSIPIHNVFSQFADLASKWFFLLLRSLLTPLFQFQIWRGLERHSKQPIKVAYIGDLENSRYLQDLIFGKIPEETKSGALYWWQLKRAIRKIDKDIDLSLMEVQFPISVLFQNGDMLRVPRWVKQRVSIDPNWENVEQDIRRKTRKEARRLIRKHAYQAHIAHGKKAATSFYDQIYRPYVFKRYGATAMVVSRRRFLRECRHGHILELLRDGDVVAASLIRPSGRQFSIVWTGIKTDLDYKESAGASDVLDYFSLCYAHQHGYQFLDLGPSRPRLNDGLLRYKKKWGAALYTGKIPQGFFVVIPHNFTPVIRSMLAAANFITLEKGRLIGKVLVLKDIDPDGIEKRIRNDWADGLEILRYYIWHPSFGIRYTAKRGIEFISLKDSGAPLKLFCHSGSD